MKTAVVLLAFSAVQFAGLVIFAMFVETNWPGNVYPYVRYPRWVDWVMFAGMTSLALMLLGVLALTVREVVRDGGRWS